jgi:hypothetical protein
MASTSEAIHSLYSFVAAVIPGWSEGPDPESRDSGFDASHRPGMTVDRYDFAFSRRDAPEVVHFVVPLEEKRAQGRPDARRTRGLMCDSCNKMLHMSIQVWRRHPAFPAQWLYGLYEIVLVTLLFVTPSLSGSVGRPRT